MEGKLLHAGEWVRVRNLMNRHFKASMPCSSCRAISCGVVWYSILTSEVLCKKCYPPATTAPPPKPE